MSGFDDFFPDEEDEKLTEAFVPEDQRATRSRADEVVDAVEGIRPAKFKRECPKCGSDNIVMRGGSLGGTRTRKCRACGLEVPWATIHSPVVQPPNRQALSGPFYGPERPKPNRNSPPHRQALERKKK
jgi:predicted RNA-binding Zn-ribbon protein involved in translation (DUF1610 family)